MFDRTERRLQVCAYAAILVAGCGSVGALVVLLLATLPSPMQYVAVGSLPFVILPLGYVLVTERLKGGRANPYW